MKEGYCYILKMNSLIISLYKHKLLCCGSIYPTLKLINLPREYNFQNKHAPPPPARNNNIVPASMYEFQSTKITSIRSRKCT